MNTIIDDLTELEDAIEAAQEKARAVYCQIMRKKEDGHPCPALALMELSRRALAQSNDAARYSRHALEDQP